MSTSLPPHGNALLGIALCTFLTLHAAHSAEWYVSPNGDDGATGTINEPLRTLRKATLRIGPGDTLYLRGGTYQDDGFPIAEIPSGLSPSYPTIISAHSGETPVYRPKTDTGHAVLLRGKSNIVLRGLTISAENVSYTGIKLDKGSSHVTITNCVIRDCRTGHGILVAPNIDDREPTYHLITHSKIYGNGLAPTANSKPLHQIYIRTSANIIENCHIRGGLNAVGTKATWGIHSYGSGSFGNIYRANLITDCLHGIGVAGNSHADHQIYNNVIAHNSAWAIRVANGTSALIANNTSYGNGGGIIVVNSSNSEVYNNICTASNASNPGGILVSQSHNISVFSNVATNNKRPDGAPANDYATVGSTAVTLDSNQFSILDGVPKRDDITLAFSDTLALDFALLSDSTGATGGRPLSAFSTDFTGNPRPDSGWSIGAYQYFPTISAPINLRLFRNFE